MRVFIINLEKDSHRREIMKERAHGVGIEIEFFSAIDGRKATPEQLSFYDGQKRRRFFGRDLMPGEIGCLLSHRAIYEKMVQEDISMALILEDDVLFESGAGEVLTALEHTKRHWDVVRFLGSEKVKKRGCRIIAPLVGEYSLGRLPTTPGGAHAYVIKLAAAKTMLKYMEKNWLPIDTLQGRTWRTGLETLIVTPAPILIDMGLESTIGDKRFDKTIHLTGLDRLLFPFRRAAYKFEEAIAKKYIYFSSWLQDRM